MTPVLDRSVMISLFEALGQDPDFLQDLVATFYVDADDLLQKMPSALLDGNVELLCRLAHTLKSNSANFGAHRLMNLCKTLELNCKNNSLEDAGLLVDQIRQEYELVAPALSALVKEFVGV